MARQIYRRRTRNLTNPNQNLTGRAVGAIGTELGKHVDTVLDTEKARKAKEAEDSKIEQQRIADESEEWAEDQDLADLEADIIGADTEDPDFDWTDFDEGEEPPYKAEYSDIGNPNSGGNDVTVIPDNNGNPYGELRMMTGGSPTNLGAGGAENFANNLRTGWDNLWGGGNSEGNTGKPVNQGGASFWSNLGSAVQSGNQKEFLKKEHGSALKRKSPFYRIQYDPQTGTPIGEGYIQRSKAPSYLGDIGSAAAEGSNLAIDRYNYKRQVWEVKQNELDQQFGELEVPPSGVAPFDASVETMARQWKSQLAELQKNKGNMEPGEYTAAKHEIMGYSKTYKAASEQINQLLTDYARDKDQISSSTKPEVLDLIETLSQGGNVQIGNDPETGQPTLMGVTIGNKRISVPLAQIANGKNAFRYNKKVDPSQGLAAITKQLGSLKQNIETQSGQKITGPQAWEAVQGSASAQLDTLLANESTVRSIAADTFNLDYDAWEQMGSKAAKDWTKNKLMERLEQQYAPIESARTVTQPGGQSGVVNQRNAANAQAINQAIAQLPDLTPESIRSLAGGKIEEVQQDGDDTLVYVGNKTYVLPTDPQKAKWMLARIMGVQEQYINK